MKLSRLSYNNTQNAHNRMYWGNQNFHDETKCYCLHEFILTDIEILENVDSVLECIVAHIEFLVSMVCVFLSSRRDIRAMTLW